MAKTWATPKQRRTGSHLNDTFARSDAVAARRVLRDCHIGLQELERAETDAVWRLRWIALLTILRAVGHVLDKIDGKRSIFLRKSVDEIWAKTNAASEQNWIFFDFINHERNLMLKEYRVGERVVRPVKGCSTGQRDLPVLVRHQIYTQRELIEHSLAWWERLLGAVEERADTLLKNDRHKLRIQRRAPVISEQSNMERTLPPPVRVQIAVEAEKYLAGLIFSATKQVVLADGVNIALSIPQDDAVDVLAMTVIVDERVGLRHASKALADWLEQSFLRSGSAVRIGQTLVDSRTLSLRKLLAGKIARRRLAADTSDRSS